MRALTNEQLTERIANRKTAEFLVRDFLPQGNISILVGESTLGKTPFCIQLAVCVSAGIPFLGLETSPGPVLYADYENSDESFESIRDTISTALGLPSSPRIYRMDHPTKEEIETDVEAIRPSLLIIDTLRYFDSNAESTLPEGAPRTMKWFKKVSKRGVTVIFIHHPRKDNPEKSYRGTLIDTRLLEWIECSAGSAALYNQADTRIGFDIHTSGETEAIVRSHTRGAEESSPWKLSRRYDDFSGKPICYSLIEAKRQLADDQQKLLNKVPPGEHTFKDLVTILNINKRFVSEFLKRVVQLGLMTKHGTFKDTRYVKFSSQA